MNRINKWIIALIIISGYATVPILFTTYGIVKDNYYIAMVGNIISMFWVVILCCSIAIFGYTELPYKKEVEE